MYRNLYFVFVMGLAFIIFEGISIAAPPQGQGQHYGQEGDRSIRLGALGIYKPEYEGSDEYEITGFPLIDITWRDTIFLNPIKGLGAYLWNRNDVKLGLSIGYTFGRDEDDSSDLDGLGDIDSGATGNAFIEWAIGDFDFDASYEQQITGEDTGFKVNIGLGYSLRIAEKTILKPSIKTTYSSSEYMEEYFRISPSQSTRSGLPVYDADSGFKSVGIQIMVIYRLNQNWGIQSMAGYDRLVGEAADSPIVKDENQYFFGIGLAYEF